MVKVKVMWECSTCAEVYEDDKEAEECCLPEAIEVYVCGKCKTTFDDEENAEECCK